MLTFLFYAMLWVGIGVLVILMKIFILFHGTKNMVSWYLIHPKTKKYGESLLNAVKNVDKRLKFRFILIGQLIYGILFAPIAVIDTLGDVIRFTFTSYPQNIIITFKDDIKDDSNEHK